MKCRKNFFAPAISISYNYTKCYCYSKLILFAPFEPKNLYPHDAIPFSKYFLSNHVNCLGLQESPLVIFFGVVPAYSLFLLTPALEFILIVDLDFYADLTLCLPCFVLLGFISFLKLNRFWPLSHAS